MKKVLLLLSFLFTTTFYAQNYLPSITLKTLEGQTITTDKDYLEKDKLYVFSFWATWCAPCIQELNAINEVYDDWKEELNIEVIAVSVDDARTEKRVKPMVNGKGWEYTVLLDTNQDFKRSMSITNPPFLMVVKNNEIVYTKSGHSPGAEAAVFEIMKSL